MGTDFQGKFGRSGMARPLLAVLLLAGCAVPVPRTPEATVDLAAAFARAPENPAAPAQDNTAGWWRAYDNEEIDRLVAAALYGNPGLNQIRARLAQAEAAARGGRAALWPSLDAGLSRDTERGDRAGPSEFSLRGAASYEVDVWGRNNAEARSGSLSAAAAAEDVRAAAMTLTAQVVETWLRLLALAEEEALLSEQRAINATMLELQQKRYESGVASAVAVLQQQELLARADAQLPDIRAAQEIARQQLALLTGGNPSVPPQVMTQIMPPAPAAPATGVPADLLADRPDIAASWLRLRAADWNVAAAEAARLPSLNITANYGTAAAAFSQLTQSWLLTLAANLALPIIDGGARRAETRRQEALADERVHAYKETVLTAIADVEAALTTDAFQRARQDAVERQLEAARNALQQAQISYAQGGDDYLSVLNGLTAVQGLERQIINERRDNHLNRVALYRALGPRGAAFSLTIPVVSPATNETGQ